MFQKKIDFKIFPKQLFFEQLFFATIIFETFFRHYLCSNKKMFQTKMMEKKVEKIVQKKVEKMC